jgi:RNA polymerase sigma-70 factor (ECF subfamily)
MARNQVIDQYRKQRPTTDLEGIDPAVDAEAEEAVLAQERNERLRAAMDRLSPDHREVLVQRFLMEKSAAEIGEAMDRKEVTVRGLQMRALRALRKELEAIGACREQPALRRRPRPLHRGHPGRPPQRRRLSGRVAAVPRRAGAAA